MYKEWSNLLFGDSNTALTCFWIWFKPLVLAMASQHACTLWFEMVFAHVLKQLLMVSSIYMNRNPKQHDQLVWTFYSCLRTIILGMQWCAHVWVVLVPKVAIDSLKHPTSPRTRIDTYIYTRILQIEYCQGISNDEFKTLTYHQTCQT